MIVVLFAVAIGYGIGYLIAEHTNIPTHLWLRLLLGFVVMVIGLLLFAVLKVPLFQTAAATLGASFISGFKKY